MRTSFSSPLAFVCEQVAVPGQKLSWHQDNLLTLWGEVGQPPSSTRRSEDSTEYANYLTGCHSQRH